MPGWMGKCWDIENVQKAEIHAYQVEDIRPEKVLQGHGVQEQWGTGLCAVRLSEGRGQNNQQPTPNDNNKRVVVFLCGSGI